MDFVRASSIGLSLIMFTTAVSAQATPFLFTVMPPAGQSKSAAYGYYELGYGERTFEPVAGDRLEQALGVRATIGHRSWCSRARRVHVGGDTSLAAWRVCSVGR
jgi:hypothetical protein